MLDGGGQREKNWDNCNRITTINKQTINQSNKIQVSLARDILTLKNYLCPGQVAQLVGASSHTLKDCEFDSWSRHIPRLGVQCPIGVSTGGNQ